MLAEGATAATEPNGSGAAPDDPREQLEQALERARRLLRRRTAARRGELAVGLQELSDSVAAALQSLPRDSGEDPV
jgi:hypothetical protein